MYYCVIVDGDSVVLVFNRTIIHYNNYIIV